MMIIDSEHMDKGNHSEHGRYDDIGSEHRL